MGHLDQIVTCSRSLFLGTSGNASTASMTASAPHPLCQRFEEVGVCFWPVPFVSEFGTRCRVQFENFSTIWFCGKLQCEILYVSLLRLIISISNKKGFRVCPLKCTRPSRNLEIQKVI